MHPRRKISIGTTAPQQGGGGAGAQVRKTGVWATIALLLGFGTAWVIFGSGPDRTANTPTAPSGIPPSPPPGPARTHSVDGVFRESVPLEKVLDRLAVPAGTRDYLLQLPELRVGETVAAGRPYRLLLEDDEARTARALTYEKNDTQLFRLRFRPYAELEVVDRRITRRTVAGAGIISRNFWLAILESDSLHHGLIPLAEEALKWTVDLFHLEPGDRFKLVYTELLRDGEVMGIERLDAARIETRDRIYTVYGIPVRPDSLVFVDSYGASLRQRFLRAPVKFGIISSPFSLQRIHPVTGVAKRHGGTDFAAPAGSPVLALADGTISRQAFGQFNGTYVELRHDAVYSTMYLHLKDFAPGLRAGSRVRQGEVIGYVGSTGQSTGPHVCLRFRENDREVDFQRYRGSEAPQYLAQGLPGFIPRRDSLLERLERLEYREILF